MTAEHPAPPTLLQLVDASRSTGSTPAPFLGSPEAMLISALLDAGDYSPRRHGVPDAWFHVLGPVHRFCTDYQAAEGVAPPVSLVLARFPSFAYSPGVGPSWAAHEVAQAQTNRTLRAGLAKAARAVAEEAYPEAVGVLRDTVERVATVSSPGTDVTDFSLARADVDTLRCPIPAGTLAHLTGGHGAGQLWLVAALWGVGKTFKLVEHAVAAAEGGWDVVFFSLEMSTSAIQSRLWALIAAHAHQLAGLLDLDAMQALVADWAARNGRVQVIGPDRGRVDVTAIEGAIAHPRTLVIIDYVGKMFATDGRHAGSGHEVFSLVSKELSQSAGFKGVPILGAAQIGRSGMLGGTISLEQDADLILELKRISPKVDSIRQNLLVKTRHTALHAPWFTRFDPAGSRFEEISGEEAMAARVAEEALLYT